MKPESLSRPTSASKGEIDTFQAWKTLACVCVQNATTLGALKVNSLIFEQIVTQKYYSREDASWPIATASTIQNLAGPLTPLLATKMSWRSIELIQTTTLLIAYLGAHLSNSLTIDILCLGVLQGIGLSIRYNMNVVINNDYFDKYRTTAMGFSLAGSTCGVFILKPIVSHYLDSYGFRATYLCLGIIISLNYACNLLIRKPKKIVTAWNDGKQPHKCNCQSIAVEASRQNRNKLWTNLIAFLSSPTTHVIWILQTIYFYNNRSYTIFVVDYGIDKSLSLASSRRLLDAWVYGELFGRLLLGSVIDLRLFAVKWDVVIVNLLLAVSGGFLLVDIPKDSELNFWYLATFVALVAATTSLVNMVIVPYAQETIARENVPWTFAVCSVISSVVLLLRPVLFGVSRDVYGSYSLLIMIMSVTPAIFAILFVLVEPLLSRYRQKWNEDQQRVPS